MHRHLSFPLLFSFLFLCSFNIIVVTEHKIRKGVDTLVKIDIPGYKPFIFDATETSHGGTGFYVKESLQITVRDDLKFNSPGNFESTFIESMFPNTKNVIIGSISLNHFTSDYIEHSLDKISSEGKTCSLVGDFNIDPTRRVF